MAAIVALAFTFLIMFQISSPVKALSSNYYDHTCLQLESIVTSAVKKAMLNDKIVPSTLLRMHFHDCFIRGCDASVLLNSKGKNKAEKDGPPKISLHVFYVIDHAKTALESKCPGIVSCANILALAARDAVALNFAHRGLSIEDLVALSGGHTLGFSHYSSFQNRIHNFSATLDVDPTMNPPFVARLRSVCLAHNKVKNARLPLDSSNFLFDNAYYKLVLQGKSIFSSDQALLTTPKTKALVSKFASSQKAFENAFVNSMIKMSSFIGGQ
ncbi:hypothetical protein REPUB_Repub03eG0169000 [Reevesia pubescens]